MWAVTATNDGLMLLQGNDGLMNDYLLQGNDGLMNDYLLQGDDGLMNDYLLQGRIFKLILE